jgi:hypothetical protein
MKTKETTFEDTRDREADEKNLADAFIGSLSQVTHKKSKNELWGLDPGVLMGHHSDTIEDEVLAVIGYDENEKTTCPHCDSELELDVSVSPSDARDYARELWDNLGFYLANRWYDANVALDEKNDVPVCIECGDEVEVDEDEVGPFTCTECDEETDEDDSEDDSEDAEDVCCECGCEMDDCDCDEDSEEEEEDEDLETCYNCEAALNEDGDCPKCTCDGCGFDKDDCCCDEEE